jgi:hypothetical protein
MFAAIALHLRLLVARDRLGVWYTPVNLKALGSLGACFSVLSLGFTLWYIIYASNNNIRKLKISKKNMLL